MSLLLIIAGICSCQNTSVRKLEDQVQKLTKQNSQLKKENIILKRKLNINSPSKEEKEGVYICKVKTGFIASDVFCPAVILTFKNNSSRDLTEHTSITATFIDNNKKEQISDDLEFLASASERFIAGCKKQITLKSSVGWYALRKQSVTVRIYINQKFYKAYKIKTREIHEY